MGSTAVFREINKIVIVSTVYKNHSVTFLFNKGIILNLIASINVILLPK